jgi:hypothetical protein
VFLEFGFRTERPLRFLLATFGDAPRPLPRDSAALSLFLRRASVPPILPFLGPDIACHYLIVPTLELRLRACGNNCRPPPPFVTTVGRRPPRYPPRAMHYSAPFLSGGWTCFTPFIARVSKSDRWVSEWGRLSVIVHAGRRPPEAHLCVFPAVLASTASLLAPPDAVRH